MATEQLVVFVDEHIDPNPILQARPAAGARIHSRWSDFTDILGNASAAGLVIQDLTRARTRDIIALRAAKPLLPLVLVTSVGRATLRRINRLPELENIIRIEDLPDQFGGALIDAANRRLLLQAAAWIEAQEHLPADLRFALMKACKRRVPLRTVEAPAKFSLGASPKVLRDLWGRAGIRTRPHAFIDWLLLAHARAASDPGATVSEQARRSGVERHTLQAARRRLLAESDRSDEEPSVILQTLKLVVGRGTDDG
jgi:hypothetical protein